MRGRIEQVSDVRICYCTPKGVLCEIFFVEKASRNILKDFFFFFGLGTVLLKF